MKFRSEKFVEIHQMKDSIDRKHTLGSLQISTQKNSKLSSSEYNSIFHCLLTFDLFFSSSTTVKSVYNESFSYLFIDIPIVWKCPMVRRVNHSIEFISFQKMNLLCNTIDLEFVCQKMCSKDEIYLDMNMKRMQMPTVLSGTSRVFKLKKRMASLMVWVFQKIDFYNCRTFNVQCWAHEPPFWYFWPRSD